MEKSRLINYDLDSNPLQIRTKTQTFTNPWILNMDLWKATARSAFRRDDAGNFDSDWLGNIRIVFGVKDEKWKYALGYCNEDPTNEREEGMELITNMPELVIDVNWEFKNVDRKFIVTCNKVVVIEVSYNDEGYLDSCKEKYGHSIGKISFRHEYNPDLDDTASRIYRIKPQAPNLQDHSKLIGVVLLHFHCKRVIQKKFCIEMLNVRS